MGFTDREVVCACVGVVGLVTASRPHVLALSTRSDKLARQTATIRSTGQWARDRCDRVFDSRISLCARRKFRRWGDRLSRTWEVWCTSRRARYVAAVVSLLAAAVTALEFFDSRVVLSSGVSPGGGVTSRPSPRRVMTSLGKSRAYAVGYKYANQMLFTFVPQTSASPRR